MKLRTGMMGMAMMAGVSLGMNAQTAVDSRMLVNAPPAPAGIMGGLAGGVSLGMSSVKGQPYTLVEKTTTVKLLSDATTTITTVREEKKSRDGEGRERTESGTIKDGVFVPQFVRISDPVAHTSTTLMPQSKTARVTHLPAPKERTPEEEAKMAEMRTKREALQKEHPEIRERAGFEALGSRNIAGVAADGTRFTHAVPAGTEGNDREFKWTLERWVSPDLQIPVMTVNDDPRIGKMTVEVTELQRGEPDTGLFQVPADYKVTETKSGAGVVPDVALQ